MSGIRFSDARAPDGMRLYAIGDVHGRLDLLQAMHRAIADELDRDAVSDWRVIHLGDYIDRGPDSRGVVDFLIAARQRDGRNLMLAGNHEIGMLDYLKEPNPRGLFVRYGGIQTAQSYGVDLLQDGSIEAGHRALLSALPRVHVEFLLSLSFTAQFGDIFFCHAGIRPGVPLDRQDPQDLVWIRDGFLDYDGLHPKLIVHGHTPNDGPRVLPNRVNLDSYAWSTGHLTALVVNGTKKRLLTATVRGVDQREAVTP